MLKEKVRSTLLSYELIYPKDVLLLAVSGGPDSVAMLNLFYELRNELKVSLLVAHYNHKQRDSSDEDESFVYGLCQELGLECIIGRLEETLPPGLGKEAAMRKVRYQFLLKAAQRSGANKIVLAHNLDDQAETVLMNLLRGSGLQGLRGIPIKRRLEDEIFIIRPLLFVSRSEIELYIKEKGLQYRVDESNFSFDFLRNRVRLELLPWLEREYNKQIKLRLSSFAQIVERDFDYIYSQAEKVFEQIRVFVGKGEVLLSRQALELLHESILRQVFRITIEKLAGSTSRIDFRHYIEFVRMLKSWPERSVLDMPQGVSIEKRKKLIRFYLREES